MVPARPIADLTALPRCGVDLPIDYLRTSSEPGPAVEAQAHRDGVTGVLVLRTLSRVGEVGK